MRIETIFDDAAGHYELLSIGWSRQRRIDSTLVHIDLHDSLTPVEHTPEEWAEVEREFQAERASWDY